MSSSDNTWKVGLFQCFRDPKLCIYTIFCPTCLYGTNANIAATKNSDAGIDFPSCCICCCTLGCCLYLPCSLRSNIRNNHNIKGSLARDALEVYCCTLCAMAQHHLELNKRFPTHAKSKNTAIIPSSMGGNLGDSASLMKDPDEMNMMR